MNAKHSRLPHDPQRGVTIVELLVAVAVAMLASLIVMQIATNFEGQKRTTSSAADAQTNSSIGLYAVARQVQTAGFGLPMYNGNYPPLSCVPQLRVFGPDGARDNILFPVTVNDGPNGAPDQLIIRSVRLDPPLVPANSLGGIPLRVTSSASGGVVTLFGTNMACQAGDIAIAIRRRSSATGPATCLDGRVTAAPAGLNQLSLGNLPGGAYSIPGANDVVVCMPNWTETTFQINPQNQLEELIEGNPTPNVLASDVVSMHIQYGVAAGGGPVITNWVEPAAVGPLTTVRALRIAIIARNEQRERPDDQGNPVTPVGACQTLSGTVTPKTDGICAWEGTVGSLAPAVNIELNNPDYQNYRYSVREMIVPMRNLLMNTGTL